MLHLWINKMSKCSNKPNLSKKKKRGKKAPLPPRPKNQQPPDTQEKEEKQMKRERNYKMKWCHVIVMNTHTINLFSAKETQICSTKGFLIF